MEKRCSVCVLLNVISHRHDPATALPREESLKKTKSVQAQFIEQ